jgi:type IV secretion system protein VirB2
MPRLSSSSLPGRLLSGTTFAAAHTRLPASLPWPFGQYRGSRERDLRRCLCDRTQQSIPQRPSSDGRTVLQSSIRKFEMAPNAPAHDSILHSQRTRMFLFICLLAFMAFVLPDLALAQDATDTIDTTCKFASNINKILNAVSIIVVTIAVVFSGYQIAFAHKRISDVSPVLIGAILIGAAGQIAKMFLAGSTSASGATACTASVVTHLLTHYA